MTSEIKPRMMDGEVRCSAQDCPAWRLRKGKVIEFEHGKCSRDPNENVVVEGETICVPARVAELEQQLAERNLVIGAMITAMEDAIEVINARTDLENKKGL